MRISSSLFPRVWIDAPASGSESRRRWWVVGRSAAGPGLLLSQIGGREGSQGQYLMARFLRRVWSPQYGGRCVCHGGQQSPQRLLSGRARMNGMDLLDVEAAVLGHRLGGGDSTVEDHTERVLERIRKRDPELNAFSQLNPGALTCAR